MQALHAVSDNIITVFSDTYIIPEYQRPYTWNTEKCEELWTDIAAFYSQIKESDRSDKYFLGCITIYKSEKNSDDWLVTDGQQRLITLSLLIKALYQRDSENKGLLACLCQEDINTRNIDSEKPRIVSNVLEGDNKGFEKIITKGEFDNKTRLGKNYAHLKKLINAWDEISPDNPQRISDLVTILLENVEILRIKSDGEDDALQIFETINNRGKALDDADILKVQLCRSYHKDKQADFISKWKELENPLFLFNMYMYILRANDDHQDITKPKLKKYFKGKNKLSNNPDQVMEDVAKIQDIRDENWNMHPEIEQWWKVIEAYPNEWWQYPLYTFLFNRMEKRTDNDSMWDISKLVPDLKNLIKETMRYIVIKGINYRAANRIKPTILQVCSGIANGEKDYLSAYDKDIEGENDKQKFIRSIEEHDSFGQYHKVLVYLNSCLFENEFGERRTFHKKVDRMSIQVEHILPKNSNNNYDDWDEETHLENVNKLGNLILVDRKVKVTGSGNFFNLKKDVYKDVYKDIGFAEVKELAESDIMNWGPADLQERDEQVKARIFKFLEIEK